jgi:hypothetical protein
VKQVLSSGFIGIEIGIGIEIENQNAEPDTDFDSDFDLDFNSNTQNHASRNDATTQRKPKSLNQGGRFG